MVDRNALARATESTTSPTPGYLYNDIAKSAATSPSAASEIATYLIRRLQSKNNVNIKYKCLKVIQMVASHPATRGQFKRVIIQDTNAISAIKLCLQFRGPPDAIHGDMLYEKVRNQAKETLDAVYSDDPSSEQQGLGGSSGFASQPYGGGGGGGGSSGYGNNYNSGYGNASSSMSGGGGMGGMGGMGGPKKMEGIGNPMFADPRLNQRKEISEMTVKDVISGVKEGFVGMIKDPLARNLPSVGGGSKPGNMGGMNNNSYGGPSGGWNSAPPGQSQLTQSTNGAWTMASNRGPNAISSESYKAGAGNVSSGVGGTWGSSTPSVTSQSRQMVHNPNPIVNISGSTGGAKIDGTYERNLITELCPPGGMKAEPPPDKMHSFAQAIPSLNPDLICPALLDALEDGQPWIIRAKALCVMEVSINVAEESVRSGTSGNNAYADFFHACKDEIEPLATHSRSAVRDPAKRVLKALGLDVPEKTVASAAPIPSSAPKTVVTAPSAPAVAPNLLDFDEPAAVPADVPPLPPSEAPPAPPAVAASSQSLFGGMQMKSETKTQVASTTPAPVVSTESDLLGNVHQQTSASTLPSTSGDSLFDDVAVKTTLPVATPAPAFEKENVENAANANTTSSSGFSFISESKEADKPQSNPAPSKDSFDPLLGLTGAEPSTTQNNPLIQTGLNPQMAAVVQQQQQQILMMQAQMQQMQVANSARYMMMQQQQPQGQMLNMNNNNSSIGVNPMMPVSMKQNVMGAQNGSGVATSFAFMEDPNKAKKDATNKKFEFVQDAMKGAR